MISNQIIRLPEFTPNIMNPMADNSIEELAGGIVKGN